MAVRTASISMASQYDSSPYKKMRDMLETLYVRASKKLEESLEHISQQIDNIPVPSESLQQGSAVLRQIIVSVTKYSNEYAKIYEENLQRIDTLIKQVESKSSLFFIPGSDINPDLSQDLSDLSRLLQHAKEDYQRHSVQLMGVVDSMRQILANELDDVQLENIFALLWKVKRRDDSTARICDEICEATQLLTGDIIDTSSRRNILKKIFAWFNDEKVDHSRLIFNELYRIKKLQAKNIYETSAPGIYRIVCQSIEELCHLVKLEGFDHTPLTYDEAIDLFSKMVSTDRFSELEETVTIHSTHFRKLSHQFNDEQKDELPEQPVIFNRGVAPERLKLMADALHTIRIRQIHNSQIRLVDDDLKAIAEAAITQLLVLFQRGDIDFIQYHTEIDLIKRILTDKTGSSPRPHLFAHLLDTFERLFCQYYKIQPSDEIIKNSKKILESMDDLDLILTEMILIGNNDTTQPGHQLLLRLNRKKLGDAELEIIWDQNNDLFIKARRQDSGKFAEILSSTVDALKTHDFISYRQNINCHDPELIRSAQLILVDIIKLQLRQLVFQQPNSLVYQLSLEVLKHTVDSMNRQQITVVEFDAVIDRVCGIAKLCNSDKNQIEAYEQVVKKLKIKAKQNGIVGSLFILSGTLSVLAGLTLLVSLALIALSPFVVHTPLTLFVANIVSNLLLEGTAALGSGLMGLGMIYQYKGSGFFENRRQCSKLAGLIKQTMDLPSMDKPTRNELSFPTPMA